MLDSGIELTPQQFLGIPLALAGAVLMSLGAQFQHRGVNKVGKNSNEDVSSGLSVKSVMLLLARPSWVVGTLLLGLALVLQMSSLALSPLIVVQPLGSIALIITAILNSRISKIKLNKTSIIAIILSVVGVASFVSVAAFSAVESTVTDDKLITLLIVQIIVSVLVAVFFLFYRHKMGPVSYIILAGILYGMGAIFTKVILLRFLRAEFELLTLLCLVSMLLSVLLGAYFIQTAYANGPPDLVIAGLTVVDPLVAITLSVVVMGEAAYASAWAVAMFLIAGAVAIVGVILLSRSHPQLGQIAHSKASVAQAFDHNN